MAHSVSRLSLCIDATLGDGGHSLALLQSCRRARVIGVDCDQAMLARAEQRLQRYTRRMRYVHDHYDDYLAQYSGRCVQFVLFDLGLSMTHIAASERGFTFTTDQPLDMRFDAQQQLCAADIVNTYSRAALQQLFTEYGQERRAAQIATAIVAARQRRAINSTAALTQVVQGARSRPPRAGARSRSRIHPATRVFQALRIAVNDELARLQRALAYAVAVVSRGGIVAAISFHSGEDRIVKHYFNRISRDDTAALVAGGVITPSAAEVRVNRAARSATLRAVRKVIE